MIRQKTKTEFDVPTKRGSVKAIVRKIISSLDFQKSNVIVTGYYYYINKNEEVVKIDDIKKTFPKAHLESAEAGLLPDLVATENIYDSIYQRLMEFDALTMQKESGENFGTIPSDWENDILK